MSFLPVKKIVCPIDFSQNAHDGLRAAVEMAQELKAELCLVHVVPVVPVVETTTSMMGADAASFNVQEYTKMLADTSKKQLDDLIKNEVPDKIAKKGILKNGKAEDQILAAVEEENADMIVLSTHGHTGLSRLLMGSVAEKVIRHATVPVLVIRIQDDKS